MAISREQFDHELAEILNEEMGSGLFSQNGYGPRGRACVHQFPQATGLGSWVWTGRYRKRLAAEVPDWTEFAHPYHVIEMCRLAIEHRRRLPKVRPELPIDEDKSHV